MTEFVPNSQATEPPKNSLQALIDLYQSGAEPTDVIAAFNALPDELHEAARVALSYARVAQVVMQTGMGASMTSDGTVTVYPRK